MHAHPAPLLLAGLLLKPGLVIIIRHHIEIRLHLEMLEPAQLGAGDLVPADLGRREMNRDQHSRHRVLFEAQVRREETVSHVLGTQD